MTTLVIGFRSHYYKEMHYRLAIVTKCTIKLDQKTYFCVKRRAKYIGPALLKLYDYKRTDKKDGWMLTWYHETGDRVAACIQPEQKCGRVDRRPIKIGRRSSRAQSLTRVAEKPRRVSCRSSNGFSCC
ncbi:hypothetical protein EVAR_80627_1 [Eumeta japonica]|uniref:Uncharacterized protein n=1 Tax=Eumeta variegata TaxID=151549 RepID=A0A4C1YW54_EUMVA|nr:hypothetical protein EVAR_80627_1 [Eumeta japonica]